MNRPCVLIAVEQLERLLSIVSFFVLSLSPPPPHCVFFPLCFVCASEALHWGLAVQVSEVAARCGQADHLVIASGSSCTDPFSVTGSGVFSRLVPFLCRVLPSVLNDVARHIVEFRHFHLGLPWGFSSLEDDRRKIVFSQEGGRPSAVYDRFEDSRPFIAVAKLARIVSFLIEEVAGVGKRRRRCTEVSANVAPSFCCGAFYLQQSFL